ncbi:MAG: N4-gp56 family major capsid protein [Alphaproteobacteria bacterium]
MAEYNPPSSDALTLKLWAKKAFADSVKPTLFGKLMGTKDTSIVQVKDDLKKSAGDRVRFRLRALPQGQGVTGDETLEGNEEGMSFSYMDLNIDLMRYADKVDMKMGQQRSIFDVRSEAKDMHAEWWDERYDSYFLRTLSGDTTLSFAGNTITAPTSVIFGGNATATGDIDVNDVFDLTAIDRAVEKAKLASPTMRKADFGGKKGYVCILHPYQVYNLRTNTNAGQWLDIQKAAMQGGKTSDNPIWSEALGVYNDVILVESTRVRTYSNWGAGSIAGARALFLGAQAGVVAFGRGYEGAGRFDWTEKTFDYGKYLGVATDCIWGLQKSVFNSADFAVIAIDTAAKSHS